MLASSICHSDLNVIDGTAPWPGRCLVPQRDTPAIVAHMRAGELDVKGLISRVWLLEQIDDAIAAMRAGEVVRAVLDLS